ncbi:NAD-dependent epimerase/dehydratase family protein [Streptomyces sp. MUM 203J]|uniref:NAD-dependent epimerase/dehydratase family protein n=1 Tax=Streptomyces sp. MUM 203J TaxID=2791990 RepID=UPI001F03F864|nr:NAD-dependent epimerase/dehydratase family protein [Streptomyces sp. MUM 203J]MCH0538068.1 NAD-dependent epimerase/dehydratase family protein [Streptomyces sp. MUM 203J]
MDICVIGGSRYFGRRVVERLVARGHRVTVVNRGSAPAPPPAGARHVVADRDDEAGLDAALGTLAFDAVVDQVCYTPRQAAVARRVLAPRTRRYLMTSTVEVYEHEHRPDALVREDAVDPQSVSVDLGLPWDRPDFLEARYGEGKRQAEAVFAQDPAVTFAAVRVAHVLGGADDFTGRLTHYAERIRRGEPIAVPARNHPATYIHVEEIADLLVWAVVEAEFTGALNAASQGVLTTGDICEAVTRRIGGGLSPVYREAEGGAVSPFSFTRAYAMDNSRATALGYSFRPAADWLDRAVAETLEARP